MNFLGFPKVEWLHLTGEVNKSVRCSRQIFSRFYIPKSTKSGNFDRVTVFKSKKVDVFWNTVCMRINFTIYRVF